METGNNKVGVGGHLSGRAVYPNKNRETQKLLEAEWLRHEETRTGFGHGHYIQHYYYLIIPITFIVSINILLF